MKSFPWYIVMRRMRNRAEGSLDIEAVVSVRLVFSPLEMSSPELER